jgi:2-polyprenyl-3-methyl-5-hydroxy-6-metoxy-1,4-benzoquinol methylase
MTHLKEDLYTCSDCGLISSNLLPDVSIYDKSYDLKYKRYDRDVKSDKLSYLRFMNILEADSKYLNILDFGCGSGHFVKYTKELDRREPYSSIDVRGFDINPYSDYCDVTALLNGFNIVTFWDSLEHIKNPKKLIKGLKPEFLFISTPSTDDHKGDMLDFHHYYPGEHVHYFNEKSLKALLDKCGYDTICINYDESKIRTSGGDKNIITIGGKLSG